MEKLFFWNFLVTGNIYISEFLWQEYELFSLSQEGYLLHNEIFLTWGAPFSSFDRNSISYDKKYSFFHRKKSFCDRYYTPFVTGSICPVTGSFACDMEYFMWQEMLFLLQGVLCASHEVFFSVTVTVFHLASPHKIYFLWDKEFCSRVVFQGALPVTGFVPSLAMNIHPMCTNSIFPVTRTIFSW